MKKSLEVYTQLFDQFQTRWQYFIDNENHFSNLSKNRQKIVIKRAENYAMDVNEH